MTGIDELTDFADFESFADFEAFERQRRPGGRGVLGALLEHGYNLMGRRLVSVFDRQRHNVLEKLRAFFIRRPGTAAEVVPAVDQIFDPIDAEIEVKAAAYGVLEQLLVNSSHVELESAAGARIRQLARLQHDTERLRSKLPLKVRVGLDETLAESMNQTYWADLGQQVREQLRRQLGEAIQGSEDLNQTVARVRQVLGRDVSQARAERIARTESTTGINGGLHLARKYLANLGLIVAKRWQAVDPLMQTAHPTRKDHAIAHGQQVPPDGMFLVGGEVCRYPGDPRLSVGQRAN